jgi:hypothetical protein
MRLSRGSSVWQKAEATNNPAKAQINTLFFIVVSFLLRIASAQPAVFLEFAKVIVRRKSQKK